MSQPDDDAPDDPSPFGQPQYKSSGELAALSDTDLADYIARSTYDFDGTSQSVRVALVRLLRRGVE